MTTLQYSSLYAGKAQRNIILRFIYLLEVTTTHLLTQKQRNLKIPSLTDV